MTGAPFHSLNPKPGDKLRFTAEHEMQGAEITVPGRNKMELKARGYCAWIALSDRDGNLSFSAKGWCHGDRDKWERVE